MAQYVSARAIKNEALFRAGESITSSQWDDAALSYLNRVYRGLATGASEFLPEFVEDWWWTRGRGSLMLLPANRTGTIAVVQDSPNATLSIAPALSMAGRYLRVDQWSEPFKVVTHAPAGTAIVLDQPYTGDTGTFQFSLMALTYTLDASVQALLGPMAGFRGNPRIIGISPERMDDLYPLGHLSTGVPSAVCLEDVRTVRFSHGGRTDGKTMRVDYVYRKSVDELIDDDASIPIIPLEYRHVLVDMTLTYLYLDKNDDRSNAVALGARTLLAAMLKDNRRRLAKMGAESVGHIYPRQGPEHMATDGPLRTDSGLIISG